VDTSISRKDGFDWKENANRDMDSRRDSVDSREIQNVDISDILADEKRKQVREVQRAKRGWQMLIFGFAFAINALNHFKETYITKLTAEIKDLGLMLSANVCLAVGFLFFGNIYDNLLHPKNLTSGLLFSLGIFTLIVFLTALTFFLEWHPRPSNEFMLQQRNLRGGHRRCCSVDPDRTSPGGWCKIFYYVSSFTLPRSSSCIIGSP